MGGPFDTGSPGPRLPIAVAVVACAVSIWMWDGLRTSRRERVLATTSSIAADLDDSVVRDVVAARSVLASFAARWERAGARDPDTWRREADTLVAMIDGLDAIEWRSGDAPDRAATSDESVATYEMRIPVEPGGGAASPAPPLALVARFGVERQLDSILGERARGYAIDVRRAGRRVFARDLEDVGDAAGWWHATTTIRVPDAGAWELELRPTRALARTTLWPYPEYLLGASIALSVVLAVLLHEWRRARHQTRVLAASNRLLEDEQRALERLNVELESRVAERTEDLEDAIEELQAFNHSVSHDLRSPLGAILNFAAILEEDYASRALDDDGLALIGRVRRSALRGVDLLDGLLHLSRAGRAELAHDRVDMTALARDAFAQARAAELDHGDAELVLEPLPPARGDRRLIGDVLANLFSNALKYSRGNDKRRVEVRGWRDGGELHYEVADNGRGFDMRYAGKLFGLFERLHADDEVEGTGVGLATVARIVRRHRGRVWARGEMGRGAVFGFALPELGAPASGAASETE